MIHTLNRNYVLAPFHVLMSNCQNNVLMGLRIVQTLEKFPDPTPEELHFFQLSFAGPPTDLSRVVEVNESLHCDSGGYQAADDLFIVRNYCRLAGIATQPGSVWFPNRSDRRQTILPLDRHDLRDTIERPIVHTAIFHGGSCAPGVSLAVN